MKPSGHPSDVKDRKRPTVKVSKVNCNIQEHYSKTYERANISARTRGRSTGVFVGNKTKDKSLEHAVIRH